MTWKPVVVDAEINNKKIKLFESAFFYNLLTFTTRLALLQLALPQGHGVRVETGDRLEQLDFGNPHLFFKLVEGQDLGGRLVEKILGELEVDDDLKREESFAS